MALECHAAVDAERAGTDDPWSEDDYRNWRRRFFGPIAKSHGLGADADDPYSLRHVYSSLRIAAGHPKPYIEASMGTSLTDSVYASVFRDLERRNLAGSYDIDAGIDAARDAALSRLRKRLEQRGLR